MNINATLLGQMITFAIFVWFTMRFVMPPVNQALEERAKTIADGLAAAEEGQKTLEDAKSESGAILTEAKANAKNVVNDADRRASAMVAAAKQKASAEKDRILQSAEAELQQNVQAAHEALTQDVAELALTAAEKILQKQFTAEASEALLEELMAEG